MRILKQLLVCLGSALATAACLFTLQLWYASYLDVALLHGDLSELPLDAKLEAVRSEEHAKLSSGLLPIDKAMAALAERGRNAFPQLAPRASDDLSAMSGWVRKPNFKPYVSRRAIAPPAEALALGTQAAPEGRHER